MGLLEKNQKKFCFILITLAVALICISFNGFNPDKLEAKEVSTQTTQMAATWKTAHFPVDNFLGYTSLFGYRISPSNGQREFHNGLDIAAPIGSYVRNWWEGTVIEVSDNSACGTMVKILSGKWQHIYCHMSGHVENSNNSKYLIDREGGIIIGVGQIVPAGARIGRVGMTGRTTGPHLHWGLIYNDDYQDPATVLTQMLRPS